MDDSTRIRRNPEVVARELAGDGGAVLLHLQSGAYHGLNPVGVVVWELLDGERTVIEVIEGVRERVAGAPPEVDQDVRDFLDGALARHLVVKVEGTDHPSDS